VLCSGTLSVLYLPLAVKPNGAHLKSPMQLELEPGPLLELHVHSGPGVGCGGGAWAGGMGSQ